jgi:hypothetical protein
MRAIRTAALAGCVLLALALVGAAFAEGPPPPPPPPPGKAVPPPHGSPVQQAEQACKAQGLQPGTDEFKACVKKAISGGDGGGDQGGSGNQGPGAGGGDQGGSGNQGAGGGDQGGSGTQGPGAGAGDQGGSGDQGPGAGDPKVKKSGPAGGTSRAKKIADACKAKGLKPGSSAFKACVKAAASGKH